MSVERYSKRKKIPTWVRYEHIARYDFAKAFLHDKCVVDCACGEGEGINVFLESGPKKIYGFDCDGEAIRLANQTINSDIVHVERAQASQLPLESGTVDVFISYETVEHLVDDNGLLDEIKRVLKPEGVVVISTPNRKISLPGSSISENPLNPYHIREYTDEEFINLLSQYFESIECYGQNSGFIYKERILNWIGCITRPVYAAWFNRMLKLPWLIRDKMEYHRVKPCEPGSA